MFGAILIVGDLILNNLPIVAEEKDMFLLV